MTGSLASAAADCGFTEHRVLVTGGAGFIGGHLVDALVQSNAVTVLDDGSSGTLTDVHPWARVVEGDVRDRDLLGDVMEDVDTVFHQAARVSVVDSIEEPVGSQAVNVGGTVKLLDSARRTDTRVVAASSAAVYGEPSTVPVPETEPLEPTSPYGIDKLAVDHYTRLFAELYDLPTAVLRYFNVYGPRQPGTGYSGVISTFLKQARSGTDLTVHGDGSQTRDFVHVNDVVRANLLAANDVREGTAFNVGTGRETSIAELARLVRDVCDSDGELVHVDGRQNEIRRSCADVTRGRRQLGFEPAVGLREGLQTILPPEATSRRRSQAS